MSILSLRKANIPDHIQLPAELVIGVEAIDTDHRLLIAQLEHLRRAHDQTVDSEIMGECAYVIGQTLFAHFKTEEEFMASSGMPKEDIQQHIRDHDRIIEEYAALQALAMKEPKTRVGDIVSTIESWITAHIAHFDVRLKPYVQA